MPLTTPCFEPPEGYGREVHADPTATPRHAKGLPTFSQRRYVKATPEELQLTRFTRANVVQAARRRPRPRPGPEDVRGAAEALGRSTSWRDALQHTESLRRDQQYGKNFSTHRQRAGRSLTLATALRASEDTFLDLSEAVREDGSIDAAKARPLDDGQPPGSGLNIPLWQQLSEKYSHPS